MLLVRLSSWLYVCLIALAGISSAQQTINLKKRLLQTPNNLEAYRIGPLLRRHAGRSHFLIQFENAPSPAQIEELKSRGARITSSIPGDGLVVSGPDESTWTGLGLKYVGRLDALDKLSQHLSERQTPSADGGNFVIVEFHKDVDMDEARALILERNLHIIERDGLLPYELLVEGSLDKVSRLVDWDEVAYVFPASEELANGDEVVACAGAITEQGTVAQYVKAGTGWPRTGVTGSPLQLDYVFGGLTEKLPANSVKSEIVRALIEWTKSANVKFSAGQNASGPRTLNIFFGSHAHGDAYPFDGAGGVLAHTFYPAPLNSEPIAGDMHLDGDESWRIGANIDLYSVALHEAGHALGLAHSDIPSAVMYPFYKQTVTLTADDINGIQSLYGAPQTVTPPAPPVVPVAPSLTIAIATPSAGLTTTAATVSASGTASGGSGTLRMTWVNDRGGSGTATGGATWTIASVALASGVNRITVTVTDGAAKTAAQTVSVTRQDPPAQIDRTAPVVQILAPGSTLVNTSAATIDFSGTASDNVGVAVVCWNNTWGGSAAASGTVNWRASGIPLLVGTNKITITAFDAAGNSAAKMITVVRR
jgi:hypothetical protein